MMELGFALLALLTILASVAMVVAPLLRGRSRLSPLWDTRNGVRAEERMMLLDSLRELERDHQLGSLADDDYQQLRQTLGRRALAALQAEDQALQEVDAVIEQAVAAERARRSGPATAPGVALACSRCGHPLSGNERYCPDCGLSLPQRLLAGQSVSPQARVAGRRVEPSQVQAAPARALGPWLLGAGVAAVLLALGVGVLVLRSPGRTAQAPIATVTAPDFHSLAFSPRRDGLVFLGTHNGLLASIDGGLTWSAQPLAGDVMAITHHPERSLEVYATGHNVFSRSDDGGRTWQPSKSDLPGLDIHGFAIATDPPQRMYAYTVGHGLFRSEDGIHWRRLQADLPGSVTALATASGGHPALYLATLDQGVFASEDGDSWRPASGFLNGALPTLRVSALAFDPRSGDSSVTSGGAAYVGALYAGTDRGIFKTIDGGASWTRLSLQSDVTALAVHPSDSRVILAADSRGRIFRSQDRGITWPGDRP